MLLLMARAGTIVALTASLLVVVGGGYLIFFEHDTIVALMIAHGEQEVVALLFVPYYWLFPLIPVATLIFWTVLEARAYWRRREMREKLGGPEAYRGWLDGFTFQEKDPPWWA